MAIPFKQNQYYAVIYCLVIKFLGFHYWIIVEYIDVELKLEKAKFKRIENLHNGSLNLPQATI